MSLGTALIQKISYIYALRYRLVIYSGDVDGCVPYVGTEEWTSGLGFPVIEEWRAWSAGTVETCADWPIEFTRFQTQILKIFSILTFSRERLLKRFEGAAGVRVAKGAALAMGMLPSLPHKLWLLIMEYITRQYTQLHANAYTHIGTLFSLRVP